MKKILCRIVLCTILCSVFFLPGCYSSFKNQTNENGLPKLRIMLKAGETFRAENNVYVETLEKKLNVKLEIETPTPSSYNERMNVMMAMGDMPDIVQINWTGEGNLAMWAQNEYLQPIDISKAPNIEMNVSSALLAMMKVGTDGKIYAVPGITTSYPYGVVIRQDWLDSLGLETPKTLDDFENVLQEFTKKDPDKNNKDDTVGITSWRLNQLGGVFAGAFQTDYLWNSIHADAADSQGIAKLREEQNGYIPFLDFIKQLYEQGLIDQSFTSLQNAETKFTLGKTGMIGAYSCDVIKLEKQLQKTVPNARLEWILCPGDNEGRVWNFIPESYGFKGTGSMFGDNAVFVITKNAKYDTALNFLDQMNSKEMILFSNLGVQGVHYEVYDSNRNLLIRTPEQSEAAMRDLFGISDTYRSESCAYLGNTEEENTRLKYYQKKGYLLITNPHSYNIGMVTETVDFQKTNSKYKDFERSESIRYVTGEISKLEYIQSISKALNTEKIFLSNKINEKYTQLVSLLQ